MVSNVRDNVIVASPKSLEQRGAVAGACVRRLGIESPALVDNIDDAVERAYTGWPDRLYVIGADGRVAWKSAPGPFGFDPAGLEGALRRMSR
jgi:type I thyroxine 5'-deiodinase